MKNRILSTFLALAFALTAITAIQAQQRFIAALNSDQVIPTVDLAGKGHCDITQDDLWGSLFVVCHYADLSGGLTAAHMHNEAAGQVGKMYSDLNPPTGDTNGTFSTTIDLTEEIHTLLLAKQLYIDLHSNGLTETSIRGQIKLVTMDNDVDGDARSDAFVTRSDGLFCDFTIHALKSMRSAPLTFHTPNCWITDSYTADFDGDGIADLGFTNIEDVLLHTFLTSSDNTLHSVRLGTVQWDDSGGFRTDQTAFGDYDRDGVIDIATFSDFDNANGIWTIRQSSNEQFRYEWWGIPGDVVCPGDYDKDGMTDLCVVRNQSDQLVWYIRRSSDNVLDIRYWGSPGDVTFGYIPVDVDGDGANDPTVVRIENGQRVFYAMKSSDGKMFALTWGLESDQYRVADFDGDGRSDFAALRNVNGQKLWYIWRSSDNQVDYIWWGLESDF